MCTRQRQLVIVHVRACVASHVSLRILRCSKASRPRELRDISTSRPSMMSRRKGRALRMTRWDSTPRDSTTPFSSWDKRDMLWKRETRDTRSGRFFFFVFFLSKIKAIFLETQLLSSQHQMFVKQFKTLGL